MEAAMTIEGFNAYLTAQAEDTLLEKVLRHLTESVKPDHVREISSPDSVWSGWGY